MSLAYFRFVGRCGIEGCRLDPCPLSAHRAYAKRLQIVKSGIVQQGQTPPSTESEVTRNLDPRLLSTSYLVEQSVRYIDRHFTDGLPSLPIETSHIDEFRGLIHHYLYNTIHRLSRIFNPHVESEARTRSVLEAIYSNPILSVCVLGNSQTDRVMLSRSWKADRMTELVYGVTLRVLRERIKLFQSNDVPWLLLLVIALTGLEFCFNSQGGMKAHRTAMAQLVAMQGGIHAVGHVHTYVVNTDRFLALCLGEYPLYGDTVGRPAKPMRAVGRYGFAFPDLIDVIDQPVIDFSENQCRLIDMLEAAGVDLTDMDGEALSRSMGSNVLPHFLYLRDKISQDHANLHGYYHDNRIIPEDPSSLDRASSISRCVVIGGHIILYLVAFADYYTIIRPMLANELESVLRRKPRSDWSGHEDIIVWLMFVLATVPSWDGHKLAVTELRMWLLHKYRGTWPTPGWEMELAQVLRGFVWSDSMYGRRYDDICVELLALDEEARRSSSSSSASSDNGRLSQGPLGE